MRRGFGATMAVLVMAWLAAAPAQALDRYGVVHGCYDLEGVAGGPFRMQATTLAQYLLYSKDGRYLGADGLVAAPSPATEWKAADAPGDQLALTNVATGKAEVRTLKQAEGCAVYPEAETNAVGTPARGATPYGATSGIWDAHLHLMAFEFIGGSARCGRPWHPYGVAFALVDCPDHEPGGVGAVLEQALSGRPGPHDTTGWPKFTDWPAYYSYTHEQTYYKWVERAWLGGLRIATVLLVDNGKLCDIYPYRRNPCDEANTLRLEHRRVMELQDYIDAQEGGPGKGWFRVVKDPFEARRVVNQGKLAIVLGIETSRLFECTIWDEVPQCDRAQIDAYFNEFYNLGVRSLQLINKFDNALGGVAGDGGLQGPIVNGGNKLETNRFWKMGTCTDPQPHVHDKPQMTSSGEDRLAAAILQMFVPLGTQPIYGPEPHCNQYGLSDLGDYTIRKAMQAGVLLDPDHLSVLARKRFMDVVESASYPGVLSSHSWSTPDVYPRIYELGGVISPAGDSVKGFIKDWREHKAVSNAKFPVWGMGFGSDVNGFSAMPPPRDDAAANPLKYPFKSYDGKVTFEKNRAGERTWDLNTEGGVHFGLYADWFADIRHVGGEEIARDMHQSAEHFLQMWERAVGVPAPRCGSDREDVTRRGVGDVLLGAPVDDLLRAAGQPMKRPGRRWQYCVRGTRNRKAKIVAVVGSGEKVALVASTARGHRAGRAFAGARASVLRGTRAFGRGVRLRPTRKGNSRFVYGVRRGRISYVAVVTPRVAKSPRTLRRYLKLAGLVR